MVPGCGNAWWENVCSVYFSSVREADDEQFSFEWMRVGQGVELSALSMSINFVFAFGVAFNFCQVYYSAIISVIRCSRRLERPKKCQQGATIKIYGRFAFEDYEFEVD